MRLHRENREHFLTRLDTLTPDSQRQWGALSVTGMIRHLNRTFEISLGEVTVPDKGNFLTKTVGKWASLYLPIPIPRGMIKLPDVFTPNPEGDFESEKRALLDKLDEFLDRLERDPERKGLSILFGWMTLEEWSYLHGSHWNHHLKQFGA
jgi:hypothetical protein